MIDETLCRDCEQAEARGFFSLVTSISHVAQRSLGIETAEIAGAPVWSCEGIPWLLFNRTIGLGLFEPLSDADLDQVAEFYRGRSHAIEASPLAGTLHADALAARGYTEGMRRPKFVRVVAPRPIPEGVEVRYAEPTDKATFADVMLGSFGLPDAARALFESVVDLPHPGRIPVLATVGGQPAGSAFLAVFGRVAWLGGGCCLPEYRGRGVQRALIEGRAVLARELGAEWLTSETNPDRPDEPGYSYRNMVKSGFEPVFDRVQWVMD